MEAIRSIETSATIYQSARCNIPEDLNLVLFTFTIKEKPQYHNQKVGEGIQNAESFGEFRDPLSTKNWKRNQLWCTSEQVEYSD
jgi:hypothetical protein